MKNLLFKTLMTTILMLISVFSLALQDSYEDYSDATIMKNIKEEIAADSLVSNLNVSIGARDGVVSLMGETNTDKEASKLVEIAGSTPGVKKVNTQQLKVKKSQYALQDTLITAKVKSIFVREKLFGEKDVSAISVNVETKNGVVYLTGTADNQDQINTAVALAKSVEGVKKVQSKVKVKQRYED